jgi:hypothetical protein
MRLFSRVASDWIRFRHNDSPQKVKPFNPSSINELRNLISDMG